MPSSNRASSSCQERDGASTYVGDFQATMEGSRAPGFPFLRSGHRFVGSGLGVQRMLRIRLYALMEPLLDLIISPGRVLLSRVWSATQSAGTAKAGRNPTFHL